MVLAPHWNNQLLIRVVDSLILINPFLTVDDDTHKSKLRFDAVVKLHNKDLYHLTFDSPSTPFDPTLHELKKIN